METMTFNQMEQVPTELMTEIKSDNIRLDDMTGSTGTPPQSFGTQPNTSDVLGMNNPNPNATNLNAGNLVTPEMAVAFMDLIIPVIFVLAFKRFHDKTISKKSIQLTSTEKDTLKQPLQNYLNSINFSVDNPLNALLLTLSFIYGMKYIEVQNEVPNGTFKPGTANIGQPTAAGTIKRDGRGRPKGTIKKFKQVI